KIYLGCSIGAKSSGAPARPCRGEAMARPAGLYWRRSSLRSRVLLPNVDEKEDGARGSRRMLGRMLTESRAAAAKLDFSKISIITEITVTTENSEILKVK